MFQSHLVYSNKINVSKAIKNSYKLAQKDTTVDVASSIRQDVLRAFENSESSGWPPNHEYLKNTDVVPAELTQFLTLVMKADTSKETDKTIRVVNSIAQDICRAVTNSAWKLPKHVALCLTLRHLFRSKELITLLNRLGHCENYSFSLELETAIAIASEMRSNTLSQSIVRCPRGPSVFHSEFDNFDQLVNDLTGKGSVHTAHGLMLQDYAMDQNETNSNLPSIERTKIRSLTNIDDQRLEDCYVTHRRSPQMQVSCKII